MAAIAMMLVLSGCDYSFTQRQSVFDTKGPVAEMQLDVMWRTFYVTGFLFLTVGGALVYTIIRYRKRATDSPDFRPKQSHGNPLIEVGLIAASALMLVTIAVPTVRGIVDMNEVPEEYLNGKEPLEVTVIGYQWWWMFEYPEEGIETSNELVIPINRPVKLKLHSADVNHSFWLPKLAGKKDLIPGQENTMWIMGEEAGKYWGQCAEFCGESHARMLFRAFVKPEQEYRAWVEKQKSPPEEPDTELQAMGQKLFTQKGCVSCHRVGQNGGAIGPNLTHFGSRSSLAAGWRDNNRKNLIEWIRYPERVKPGNLMYEGVANMAGIKQIRKEKGLSRKETEALATYLLNLN